MYVWNASIYRFHLAMKNAFLLHHHHHCAHNKNLKNYTGAGAYAHSAIFLHYSIGLKLACVCFVYFSLLLFSIMRTIYSDLVVTTCASAKIKLCPWILCFVFAHDHTEAGKNDQKKIATSVMLLLFFLLLLLPLFVCSFVVHQQQHHHHWTNKEKRKKNKQ